MSESAVAVAAASVVVPATEGTTKTEVPPTSVVARAVADGSTEVEAIPPADVAAAVPAAELGVRPSVLNAVDPTACAAAPDHGLWRQYGE